MPQRNFHYEQRRLENDLVALEIFDPEIHTDPFVDTVKANPDLLTYVSFSPAGSKEEFMREFYDKEIRYSSENCLFAIIDKVDVSGGGETDGKYAGIICLSSTNPVNAVTEFGTIIFPDFQRTHVASNAIGLLLLWTLDPPSTSGLGLRRVEWKCHAGNEASRRVALRMGFELEGIARWQRVFPGAGGAAALPVEDLERRNGTKGELPGRHTATYSIVWDEWDGKRPQVLARMEGRK